MRAIITFHSIDDSGTVLSYPPKLFADLLEALHESKLPVCDLGTLLSDETRRGITLTFDDGMRSLFTSALPVIRDHAVPAHLFLTTGAVGGNNRWPTQPASAPCFDMLNWKEIEGLQAAGVLVEAHTSSHPDLRKLQVEEIAGECNAADEIIEQRLGRRPQFFAYPYGYSNERARNYMGEHYKASVTTELHVLGGNDNRAALPRLDSYYLRSPRVFRQLDSGVSRAYLLLRGMMRAIRGSQ
ncbi:MAG: hypothetical protein BMS9Abin09_0245 [Gammaproteobacteria bacterium]|nr:MAG: hypothetical protein BMS9Abin09_0245 [Gammaproteobacteria bacterium]